MTLVRYMLVTAFLLGVFTLVGTGIVAVTENGTEERIRQNEREFLLRTLNSVIPATAYDNDLHADTITVTSHELLGTRKPVTVYRARKGKTPVAAVLTPVAPDGYNGDIQLLVAIRYDGALMGVRVLSHHETPGLGDGIDIERSKWIDSFAGHSLHDPDELGWHVVKDGGIFDQFTGATISPRAVVKAVHNSLKYYAQHKEELFRDPSSEEVHPDGATDVH